MAKDVPECLVHTFGHVEQQIAFHHQLADERGMTVRRKAKMALCIKDGRQRHVQLGTAKET